MVKSGMMSRQLPLFPERSCLTSVRESKHECESCYMRKQVKSLGATLLMHYDDAMSKSKWRYSFVRIRSCSNEILLCRNIGLLLME
jgi:hypothetical protein